MDEFTNEAGAWREIARRIQTGEWMGRGLCLEVEGLRDEGRINGATQSDMEDRIEREFVRTESALAYLFPVGAGNPRLEIALRFAAEAEAEAVRLLPPDTSAEPCAA